DAIPLCTLHPTLTLARALTLPDALPISAAGLQLLGSGTVHLDESGNNVTTLAANYSGTISYTDASGLTIGTVTDTAMTPSTTTHGITSTNSDVKLTVLAGGLGVGEGAVTSDDITLGTGNLTLDRKSVV